MSQNNPHMRAESLRPKSDREQMLARIAADCGEAWLDAKDGRNHPRHYDPVASRKAAETARYAWLASFMPELPRIDMPEPWGMADTGLESRDLNT